MYDDIKQEDLRLPEWSGVFTLIALMPLKGDFYALQTKRCGNLGAE